MLLISNIYPLQTNNNKPNFGKMMDEKREEIRKLRELCSFISLFYLSTTEYPFSIYLIYLFYLIITTIFSYFIFNKIDILGVRFSNVFANKVSNSLKF